MTMKYTIRGENLPILDVELEKGESMFTELGGMAWKTPNISMQTNTRGGITKGIRRMFSGESLFMTTYTCEEGRGMVSFCTEFPGRIVYLDLKNNESIICQKDAFMVAEHGVDVDTTFTKSLGAGFFGGEGFFLQKLTGPGKTFLELAGEITEYTLEEGQSLQVDTGYLAAFEPTVNYKIERVKGIKNMLFSGEGLFLASLQGPGKIYLQSMPIKQLAKKIARSLPGKK
jgi:uncharacterized protein (TIGR00266 family)